MPETQEGQAFDEFGFCNVCRSSEEKMKIDWRQRRIELERILEGAKVAHKDDPYDCLIPISGGKDSTFQLHVLVKEYGMRPLAATFSHNWFSATGVFNLLNALEQFDIDHVMFTPKRGLVNRLAKRSLKEIGDACWHCHAGVGAYPLRVARDYGIKLIVWGESVSESSSRGTYNDPAMKFDESYFQKVSAKKGAESFVGSDIQSHEMEMFKTPSRDAYLESGILGIHLGDYIFWDEERQTEFVSKEYGWKRDEVDGTYKGYKSTECIMAGTHDFACYLKRGFGRTSFHASSDIRSGVLSREDFDSDLYNIERTVPPSFSYFSEITGINLDEFINTLEEHKHDKLKGVKLPILSKSNGNRRLLFIEQLKRWLEA